jgi:hypothetical protein
MEQIRVPMGDLEPIFSRVLDGGATWAEVAAGYPRAEG